MTLKELIYNISLQMFHQICVDMDKKDDKTYNYYFSLVNEVFKCLSLCCAAIDIQLGLISISIWNYSKNLELLFKVLPIIEKGTGIRCNRIISYFNLRSARLGSYIPRHKPSSLNHHT